MIATLHSLDEVQPFIDAIMADFKATPFEPFMKGELDQLSAEESYYFANETGPDGEHWEENKQATKDRKGHALILRGMPANDRRLARSLTDQSGSADAVREVIHNSDTFYALHGTNVEYSEWNDQGTDRIPARPHIGVSMFYFDSFCERAIDYAFEQLVRAA